MYEYHTLANTWMPNRTASLEKHSFLPIDLSIDWLKKIRLFFPHSISLNTFAEISVVDSLPNQWIALWCGSEIASGGSTFTSFPGLCFPSPFEAVALCQNICSAREKEHVTQWLDALLIRHLVGMWYERAGLNMPAGLTIMNWVPSGLANQYVLQHGCISHQMDGWRNRVSPPENHLPPTALTPPLCWLSERDFCLKCLKWKWNLVLSQDVSLSPNFYVFCCCYQEYFQAICVGQLYFGSQYLGCTATTYRIVL